MSVFKKIIPALFFVLHTCNLSAQNDNSVNSFVKSYEFEKNKDYEGAIDAIKSLPSSYESSMRLGWLYYKIGFNRTAISFYENAIKQSPNSIEAKLAYTYPANISGTTDNIIAQYKSVLTVDPKNTAANYKLGGIYYYKNDFRNALPYFETTLEIHPFNYDALLMSAWCNVKLQKNAEAEVLFNKVLLYSTSDKSAWEGLTYIKGDAAKQEKLRNAFGVSYELAGVLNYVGAIAALKPVYDKTSYELNLRLGALCAAAGLNKESVTYYNIAIALKPSAVEPRLGIVGPTLALGNMNDLIAQYNLILASDPQNTSANYRMGYINYEKKEYAASQKYFEKVVSLYPSDYTSSLMLAKTFYSLGNNAEAKSQFNKILSLYPGDKSALEGLALVK